MVLLCKPVRINDRFWRNAVSLCGFVYQHGHCNVPEGLREWRTLSRFVSRLRVLHAERRLEPEKVDILTNFQFDFGSQVRRPHDQPHMPTNSGIAGSRPRGRPHERASTRGDGPHARDCTAAARAQPRFRCSGAPMRRDDDSHEAVRVARRHVPEGPPADPASPRELAPRAGPGTVEGHRSPQTRRCVGAGGAAGGRVGGAL